MNFLRLAARIAEQSITSLPVKHDVSLPLFEGEEHEQELEKLQGFAQSLVDGVDAYLDSLTQKMESSGSVMPGEIEMLTQQRPQHAEALCHMLIEKAFGVEDEEEEEEPGPELNAPESSEAPEAEEPPAEPSQEQ